MFSRWFPPPPAFHRGSIPRCKSARSSSARHCSSIRSMRKDPHASFGKHVLTPSLAHEHRRATPPDWEVAYWDENLLQGPPPWEPFPQVVGITVHLTFAERAYELAHWYRQRGAKVSPGRTTRPVVPRGGRATRGRPGDRRGGAALARDPPRRRGGTLAPVYRGSYRRPYREDPPPRRNLLPRGLSDHDEPDRHAGLPQSLRLLLPGHRGAHDALPGPRCRAGRGRVSRRRPALRRVRRQQPRLATRVSAAGSALACTARDDLERRGDDRRDRRPVAGPRDGPGRLHGVFVGFESLADENLVEANKKTPRPATTMPGGWRSCTTTEFRSTAASCWASTTIEPTCSSGRSQWIEEHTGWSARTFHILTPYPGTPAVCRRWRRRGGCCTRTGAAYDTGHVVFRPGTWPWRSWRRATPGAIGGSSHALDLAATAARLRGRAAVPGDVVSLQARQIRSGTY